ncbi:MAG: hypothetical protein AB1611_08660 [bacterium]
MMTSLLVFILWHYAGAECWEEVVSNGFGEFSNDYAWSMATFQGKLYVGTLNSLRGAEIWSSSTGEQFTWRRVYNTLTASNSGIRCLYADGDKYLYACTSSVSGADIVRTGNGYWWIPISRRGLGDMRNTTVRCMARFGEYLYAGTGSKIARLYRSRDGLSWEPVNTGMESTLVKYPKTSVEVINNILVGELEVFNGHLYAFTWTDDLAAIRGPLSRVTLNEPILNAAHYIPGHTPGYTPGFQGENHTVDGNAAAAAAAAVDDTASLAAAADDEKTFKSKYGFLVPNYFNLQVSRAPGAFEVWRSSNGTNWEKVVGQNDIYGNGMGFSLYDADNLMNDLVTCVAVFRDQESQKEHLYLGTGNSEGKTGIWRTSEGTRWVKVLDFYELGERNNFYVWRMIPFKGRLFVGTFNMGPASDPGVTGAQIWVSDTGTHGSFHKLVGDGFGGDTIRFSGITIPKNYGIRSFGILNDTLFAGTATMLSAVVPGLPFGVTIAGKYSGCEIWKLVPDEECNQYLPAPAALSGSSEQVQPSGKITRSSNTTPGTANNHRWQRLSGKNPTYR